MTITRRLQIRRGDTVPSLLDGEPFKKSNGDVYIGHDGSNIVISDNATLQTRVSTLESGKLDASTVASTATPSKVVQRDSSGDVVGNITGTAVSSTKLSTARTISLTGGVTATGSFDGSANLALSATVHPAEHDHSLVDLLDCPTTLSDKDGFYLRVSGTQVILDEAHGIHNSFTDRDAPNSHPMEAITGLEAVVEAVGTPIGKPDTAGYVLASNPDGERYWVDKSSASVTSVGATAPVQSSGGYTPTISMLSATNARDGYATKEHIQALETNNSKVTNATHTGDVTGGDALAIAAKAVTLAKMADMATGNLLGRTAAGTGSPEVLSPATVLSLIAAEPALPDAPSPNMLLSYSVAGVKTWVNPADVGVAEPVLGNPPVDGYVLSSTKDGVRSWVLKENLLCEEIDGDIVPIDPSTTCMEVIDSELTLATNPTGFDDQFEIDGNGDVMPKEV